MTIRNRDVIQQEFNKITWHDSKFIGLLIDKYEGRDRVRLSIDLILNGGSYKKVEICFDNCVYLNSDLYISAKHMCADDILNAECCQNSEWKALISTPGHFDVIRGDRGFGEFLHFKIILCPPSGQLDILARDYLISSLDI